MTNPLNPPFANHAVEMVFDGYPIDIRKKLLYLRKLIFETAKTTPEVGALEETLRWGEPAYIPSQTKSGSLIRIHHYPSKPFDYAMYFICNTNLVEMFRQQFPGFFKFDKNRAILFMKEDKIPDKELKRCIAMALTYNLKK